MINGKVIIRILGSVILTLYLLGCTAQSTESQNTESTSSFVKNNEEESGLVQDEEEVTTLRWGVIGEYTFVGDEVEFVDKKRASNVNSVLKEKGYKIEIELVYLGQEEAGDRLETAIQQDEPFDIITFEVVGTGAEDMATYLLPLEEYMTEGKQLYEVYQVYSEEVWQANQVDGHIYNIGELIGAISPTYKFSIVKAESEPEYPIEAIKNGNKEEIDQYLKENNGYYFLPNMYDVFNADEIFANYQFHMIAPGVGLNVEGGTEFENIWESEYAQQMIKSTLASAQEGIADLYAGPKADSALMVERIVGNLSEVQSNSYAYDEFVSNMTYAPCTEQSRMVPMLEQCYTSILKDSVHIEESLSLLAALNTNAELCKSMYEEPSRGYMENPTGKFVYLCNYYIGADVADGAQIQSDRVAALTEDQISPIIGFTFDRTPVEKELLALELLYEITRDESKRTVVEGEWVTIKESAAWELYEILQTEPERYNDVLVERWQEKHEEYMQAAKEAGIDKVIEEANRQLTEWRSQNETNG